MTKKGVLVVIGGGVVGLASAVRFQDAGWRVTVVDEGSEAGAASWGNAGVVALDEAEPLCSPEMLRTASKRLFAVGGPLSLMPGQARVWAPWGLKYMAAATERRFEAGKEAMESLMAGAGVAWARLANEIGARQLYKQTGHLIVWESAETAAAGRAARRDIPNRHISFTDLDSAGLDRLAERLHIRPAGAVKVVGSGRIRDLPELRRKLQASITIRGGELRTAKASRVTLDQGKAGVVLADGERLAPDLLLIAAGARSAPLMAGAGHRVPLIGERGYHLHDPDGDWPEALSPLFFEDRFIYLNRFQDGLRLTSFTELGDPDAPPDPRKWARLREHAEELGVPLGPNTREWMGARPTLPDFLPAIGRSRKASNLIYAFGHNHLGLTLSAVTGELAAAMAAGRSLGVDLRPFDVERFG